MELTTIIAFTILVVIFTLIFLQKGVYKAPKHIFFIGPHCSGKTEAIARLLHIENKTVPSLNSHAVMVDGIEIVELPPSADYDFLKKFHIEPGHRYIFFIKNEEEVRDFPDLTEFNIAFVSWKKTESSSADSSIIYLNESADKLLDLIKK